MIISDSLPIKFFRTSEKTFNETEVCGYQNECFCVPVRYNSLITLQFNHPSTLTLKMYSEDGTLLNSQALTSIGSGYQQISFYPNVFAGNEEIKRVYFKIFAGGTEMARTDCVIIGGCLEYPLIGGEYWTWESGSILRWESEDIVTL